jgi:hypothetical protein
MYPDYLSSSLQQATRALYVGFASMKYTFTANIFQHSSTFDLLVRFYGQSSGAESAYS